MIETFCSVLVALLLLRTSTHVADAFSFSTSTTTPPKKRTFLNTLDRLLTRLQNPQEQLKDHTYLTGNYAPVTEQHVNVPVQVVQGKIPPSLHGIALRNGPNPDPNLLEKRYHWFDGHGMLHMLRFENGNAFYSNQFIPSTRYTVEKELGEQFFPTLGEYSGLAGFAKILFHIHMVREKVDDLKTVLPPNTSCLMYQDKLYCLNEGNLPFECRLFPDGSLEAVGFERFDNVLDYPVSAHPRIDHNGDLLFHSYTSNQELIEQHGNLKVGTYSAKTKKVESYFCPTSETYISFAHNMLFTENYKIVYDCSVHFDPKAMFDGGSYFRTDPECNLRWCLIPKASTSKDDVIWIDTGKPGGIVHPLNSWEEEDGTVVIWTPLCDNLELDLDTDDINTFNMVEFKLNPTTGEITKEVIDDTVNIEFSAIQTMGKLTRYGYTAIQDPSTPGEGSFTGFCVWDMIERKLSSKVYYGENEVGGEPFLVPNGDDKAFVGVYTHHLLEDQSYFLLYDGESTELVARLQMPFRVPFGFHGIWVSGEELQSHFAYHDKRASTLESANRA